MQHIRRRHGREGPDLLHTDVFAPLLLELHQQRHDGLEPEGAVAQQAEIGERFLGGAELAFALAELVAEGDEEAAVAFSLELREGQDAGDVVPLC